MRAWCKNWYAYQFGNQTGPQKSTSTKHFHFAPVCFFVLFRKTRLIPIPVHVAEPYRMEKIMSSKFSYILVTVQKNIT